MFIACITKNEEKYIESLYNTFKDIIDKLVVFDIGSRDFTIQLACQYNIRTIFITDDIYFPLKEDEFYQYKDSDKYVDFDKIRNFIFDYLDTDDIVFVNARDEILSIQPETLDMEVNISEENLFKGVSNAIYLYNRKKEDVYIYYIANELFNIEKYSDVIDVLNKKPIQHKNLYRLYAKCYENLENYSKAEEYYIKSNDNYELALFYFLIKQFSLAEKYANLAFSETTNPNKKTKILELIQRSNYWKKDDTNYYKCILEDNKITYNGKYLDEYNIKPKDVIILTKKNEIPDLDIIKKSNVFNAKLVMNYKYFDENTCILEPKECGRMFYFSELSKLKDSPCLLTLENCGKYYEERKNKISHTVLPKIPLTVIIVIRNNFKRIYHFYNKLKGFINDGGEVIIVDNNSIDFGLQKAMKLKMKVRYIHSDIYQTIFNEQHIDHEKLKSHVEKFSSNDSILILYGNDEIVKFDYKYIITCTSGNIIDINNRFIYNRKKDYSKQLVLSTCYLEIITQDDISSLLYSYKINKSDFTFYNLINYLYKYNKFEYIQKISKNYTSCQTILGAKINICIGSTYEKTKNYQLAKIYYKKAISVQYPEGHMKSCLLYIKLKEYENALNSIKFLIHSNYDLNTSYQLAYLCSKELRNESLMTFYLSKFDKLELQLEDMKIPKIGIAIGYSSLKDDIYSNELTILNLAKEFLNLGTEVYIINYDGYNSKNEGIFYYDYNKIEEENIDFDLLIVSHYMNYFCDYKFKAKQTFVLFHELTVSTQYQGNKFRKDASNLLSNVINNIDGFVVLSEYHKNRLTFLYPFINVNKIHVIGKGVNQLQNVFHKKSSNRFIWTSSFDRGLIFLTQCFHEIVKRIPDATLHIFRDYKGYETLVEELKKYPYFHVYGRVDNSKILEEFEKSEIWFYPTEYEETYCISALEAQISRTLCVCTDYGALKEIVSNRGILIDKNLIHDKTECVKKVIEILSNKEDNLKLVEDGYNWAKEQTWHGVALKWLKLTNLLEETEELPFPKQIDSVEMPQLNGYVFYPNKDVFGFDIKTFDKKHIEELEIEANNCNECVAFNTWGHLKSQINLSELIPLGNRRNPIDGIYVKYTELPGYKFYPNADINGHDLRSFFGKPLQELKEIADSTEDCVAFNTWGYLKTTFNVNQLTTFESKFNRIDGIYVKFK